MPRDDFARLERRWRERPLFLARRRRLPRWPWRVVLLALAGALSFSLLAPDQREALTAAAWALLDGGAGPGGPADAQRPTASATAARGRSLPDAADR